MSGQTRDFSIYLYRLQSTEWDGVVVEKHSFQGLGFWPEI
jgi:hypothetical protein